MAVYIYALRCPLTDAIRYIGKSGDPKRRLYGHVTGAAARRYDHHTARWLRKILANDLLPEVVILEEVPDGVRWQDIERKWIAFGRSEGWPLTNTTAGGEGLDYIDPAADARYRANVSRALKKVWGTDARRKYASERALKTWADPELTARRIAKMRATHLRPDVRAKWAAAMAEVNARPEVKAKRRANLQARREQMTAHISTPEWREAQAARIQTRWKDPEAREKLVEARWPDEERRKQAERLQDPDRQAKIQAKLSDPELIKRRNAAIKASWDRRKAAKSAVQ